RRAPLHVDLEGTVNTRDLGGWPLAAGGRTRAGRLWRSDAFTHATAADRDALARHGLRFVVDLRTDAERANAPSALAGDPRFEVLPVDLFAAVGGAIDRGEVAGDPFDLRTRYRASFVHARDGYRETFDRLSAALASSDGPVAFHCSAGKDRTGLVAALLLRAAGVPDAAILEDYLLTDARIVGLRPQLLADGVALGFPAQGYARLLAARAENLRDALERFDDELVGFAAPAAAALR
ncbi:MAG: tyrosine-protein phosphatase, partial [Trueperaceae bacterium]|nr:tyrosine-protein phosphatase [Trueperaceae bacterium]